MVKKRNIKIFFLSLIFILIFSISASAFQVKLHDRGNKVTEIQKYLAEIGYDVSIDGIFGKTTEESVKRFQKDNDLQADGIVGDSSYQKLKSLVSKKVDYELYTVSSGETLSSIAESRNVSISKLKEFNNLNSDNIKSGQDIKIPREKNTSITDTSNSGGAENENSEKIYYTVRPGDSISTIAAKRNLTVEEVMDANDLSSDIIKNGQELVLPIVNTKDGSSSSSTGSSDASSNDQSETITYEVKQGDALNTIARIYGTDVDTIKRNNNISGDRIFIGQKLVIKNARSGPFRLEKNAFSWPVKGRISSDFGWRTHPIKKTRLFHNGLDIAVSTGTKIKAAASGEVTYSGWMNGFGYTVIIEHGRGVETLYGHNSRVLVRKGAQVNKGQDIALAGNTGLSTGSHLHFGVLKDEKPLDPKNYLP
ncbi:MAG: LysM peptidoglycan-binding domain-containing protein [Bacillota bacterium]